MTQLYFTIGFVSGLVFSFTYYFEKKDKVKHIFTHIALIMVLNTFFWLIFLVLQINNRLLEKENKN